MKWIVWILLLLLNNGCNTAIARARTSKSLKYHTWVACVAAIGWIGNQLILVNILVEVWAKRDIPLFLWTCLFFTTFTVIGSVAAHYALMKWVEHETN
jgi:hypothetical protein